MKLDAQLVYQNLAQVPAEATRLNGLGLECLWSFETQHDPFLPLTLAAHAAPGSHIGTNIAVAFARSPMATAMSAWDLASMSEGRFKLGLGTQVRAHVERRFSAEWEHPAARVSEYIRCLRAIWECWQHSTKPAFEGEFYRFKLMTPFFDPGPITHPEIPIFLAGVNPTMVRTAGEVADGFHVHPLHSAKYLREVVQPTLAEGAAKTQRDASKIELHASVFVIAGQNAQEMAAQENFVRQQIAFYASTPNYRSILDLHGWSAVGEALSRKARAGEWETMGEAITEDMLDAFAVRGTLETLPELLRARYAGLLDRISLYWAIPQGPAQTPWQEMIQRFNRAG